MIQRIKTFLKKTIVGNVHYYSKSRQYEKHPLVLSTLKNREEIKRMHRVCFRFRFDPLEYCLLHFDKKSEQEIQTYISDNDKNAYCLRINPIKNKVIFDDKYQTYFHFRDYYKRTVIRYIPEADTEGKEILREFVDKHESFIIKPIDSGRGQGIEIVKRGANDTTDDIMDRMLKEHSDGIMVEELIVQSKETASLHPQSVNTLRMATMKIGDEVRIFHPWFRVGRGESVIDNASAGGIASLVDPETGVLLASGDENGNTYTTHPDTGLNLVGFKIPCWQEVLSLARELAYVLPDTPYIAWDLALTDNGWVIVEGNAAGQFLQQQMLMEQGLKPEVDEICGLLGV